MSLFGDKGTCGRQASREEIRQACELNLGSQSLPVLPLAYPWLWFLVSNLRHRAQSDLAAGTQRLTPGDLLAVMDADDRSSVVTAD